jgi:MoaA/NifB/PqqE/SkfB family radical SAM enzyme
MPIPFSTRLWVYTNYDCNLSCTYCCVRSHPKAQRRAIGLKTFQRIVDEAVPLGFEELCLTGGEPFLLPEIFEMLEYSLPRIPTTVLTNGTLITPRRLERLRRLPAGRLAFQVSIDGQDPAVNDFYRGEGSFERALKGVRDLLAAGLRVRIGATETPKSRGEGEALLHFLSGVGVSREDQFLRPLARRGFSLEGKEITPRRLLPELCVDRDGVYWHPVSTDEDFLISREVFPLSRAVAAVGAELLRREREGIQSLPYQ